MVLTPQVHGDCKMHVLPQGKFSVL
jgi:hypothetical protein